MRELAVYEKKLSRALNCPKPLRSRLLSRTRRTVQDFLAGKPDAAWDEVEDFLGNPQELAQVMLEHEDQEKLERYRKRKRILKWAAAGLAAVMFAATVFWAANYYISQKAPMNVVIETTLTIHETED